MSRDSGGYDAKLRTVVRSGLEGLGLTLAAGIVVGWRIGPELRGLALTGLGLAWLASTASVAILVFAGKSPFKGFLRAFGAGLGIRIGILAAAMAAVYGQTWKAQAAVLASYTLGVLALLMLEYRHLSR